MRRIRTREELEKLVAETSKLYVRYSRGPAKDRRSGSSRNWQTGEYEAGLSVNRVDPRRLAQSISEYAYLLIGQPGAYAWLLTGTEAGRGSDGEPLLQDWQPVAKIDRALIDEMVREANREANLAEARRQSWRYRDGEEFEIWGERFRRIALGVVERID